MTISRTHQSNRNPLTSQLRIVKFLSIRKRYKESLKIARFREGNDLHKEFIGRKILRAFHHQRICIKKMGLNRMQSNNIARALYILIIVGSNSMAIPLIIYQEFRLDR